MVMVGHRDAFRRHPFSEGGEFAAIGVEFGVRQAGARGDARLDIGLHGAGRFGIDENRRAKGFEGCHLRHHPRFFVFERPLEQFAREPAGDEFEIMLVQDRPEDFWIHREFHAGFRAGEAGFAAFHQTGFERCIAAQLRKIAVCPCDRGYAKTNFHVLCSSDADALFLFANHVSFPRRVNGVTG